MFLCNNFVSVASVFLIGFCLKHVTGAGRYSVLVFVIVIGLNKIFRADANQTQIVNSSNLNSTSTSNTTRAVGELCNKTEDCSGAFDICLYIPKPGPSIANAPPGHPECYDCETGGVSGLPECQEILDHRLRNYLLLAGGVAILIVIVAVVLCCFFIRSCPGYRCRTGRGRRGRRRGRRGGGGRHNHSSGTRSRSRTVQTQSSRSAFLSSSQLNNEGASQTKSTSNTKLSAKKGKKKGKLKNKSKKTIKSGKSKRSSKKSKKSGKTKKTKKSKLGKRKKAKNSLKNKDE